ncbi:unnamed protein product, partial [Scytosiphon promiscuus]
PGRADAHHHRDDSGNNVVVAPLWMPHAQGRSGLGEPDHSWADEDGGVDEGNDDDTDAGGAEDLDRILVGGLHRPGMNTTRPVLDDIDLTGRGDDPLRAANFAATYPEPSATPLTMAPSPWFTTRWNFGRPSRSDSAGGADGDGRYRWNSQAAATPRRDDVWGDLGPMPNAAFPRRSDRSSGITESSPMHDTSNKGDASEQSRPALLPERKNRPWAQRLSRSMKRLRRRAVKELGPPRVRNGEKEKNPDNDSGVVAWKWWDNFRNAPGLAGRLTVCILAVCALWSTSLNIVVDVTSQVIPSPALTAVVTAVVHAYYIVQEQREASEDCVARQSLYCDSDIAAFEIVAREESVSSLSSTAATFEIAVDAQALIENVTFEVPESIAASLADIAALGETLVSCVSLRGEVEGDGDGSGGSACPIESARELADYARLQLDIQLEAARAGFQEYVYVFDEYYNSAEEAYDNWISFYEGVSELLIANRIDLVGEAWMSLDAGDFVITDIELPSANDILTGFSEALTSAEIWENVSEAFSSYSNAVASRSAQINAEVGALQEEWYSLANEALADVTGDSSTLLGSVGPDFQTAADRYYSNSLALLNGLGPAAPNLSFPASPSLNSTLVVGSASTVLSSPVEYTFAAFTSTTAVFEDWVVSIGNLALLLLAADYIFRATSSLRLFVRFWGRGGLGLPDADVRVDKKVAAGAGGIVANTRETLVRVLLHPATTVVFFGCVMSLVLSSFASLYAPLFDEYRAGCVEKVQNGSFFTQNVYSIAYNYAADQGNRDQWNYQEDHTSRRGALCVELTAEVRQYLTEIDAQLRSMYEAHHDDVTAAAILGACIDTAGMDVLYAEACCGHDGNNNTCSAAAANSTLLQCPLNFASGVGEMFTPLQTALSDPSCAPETLETLNWKVEDGIALDCDTIPTCRLTCAGPNEELLRIVTTHAGCMVEWYFHANTVKLAATLLMFLFLNISRIVLVGGIVKLNWRRLHPGIFTYKGTCTRAGELIVKNPEEKAGKSREGETSKAGSGKSPLARARSRFGARARTETATPSTSRDGVGERDSKTPKWGGGAFAAPGAPRKEGGAVDEGDGGGKSALPDAADAGAAVGRPPDAPKERPMTFKRVISGAVEEGLGKYEDGARWRILLGVLLNIPWMLVLWYGRGSNTAYVAD